jgi:hypothetical protein
MKNSKFRPIKDLVIASPVPLWSTLFIRLLLYRWGSKSNMNHNNQHHYEDGTDPLQPILSA